MGDEPVSKLVIVESPSKAKTIKKYLGPGYEVVASMGHVRDLPEKRLSVDVKHDFAPKYTIIKGKDKLDLLTVYRDRHAYPHRLCSAIEQYGLTGKVVNSHRAVDDVLATLAVMEEMEKERQDLHRYVNLFGYNPKYGIEGKAISSVTYKPQSYNPAAPLYET